VIRAAGGVVVRDGLIAVVHRPHRQDWSLPKGKLEPGESDEQAAVREVLEETGWRAEIRHDLGAVGYVADGGRQKTVRYFVMAADGEEAPLADDVDEVVWLELEQAEPLLTYATDREVLARARPHIRG
jgi:ADP-ribose pyrophosphatase YjhB (NUDIX family)